MSLMNEMRTAFRLVYMDGKQSLSKEISIFYGKLQSEDLTSRDFFYYLSNKLSEVLIPIEGKRVLLELPLDSSISNRERTKIVASTLLGEEEEIPALFRYPYYLEYMVREHSSSVYMVASHSGREEYPELLAELEHIPYLRNLISNEVAYGWARGVLRLSGVAKEMFIEGMSISVSELREICE